MIRNKIKLAFIPAFAFCALLACRCYAQESKKLTDTKTQAIFPKGQLGPAANFTGKAWNIGLVENDTVYNTVVGNVYFEPGARTAWHTHPLGQTLIIVSGCGWVQKEGASIEEVYPGDVIWFEPNEKHWHGATATNGMTHIAIQENLNGKVVDWLEKVTDEQYNFSR